MCRHHFAEAQLLPSQYDHCCCSLSPKLLHSLGDLLPAAPALTISIGSGHGLLESLLLKLFPKLDLRAIEVAYIQPQYLPETRIEVLRSTSEIWVGAAYAQSWMFVYPRELGLLSRYLEAYVSGSVQQIIWLGPRGDQSTIEKSFDRFGWRYWTVEDIGLPEYECCILSNKP